MKIIITLLNTFCIVSYLYDTYSLYKSLQINKKKCFNTEFFGELHSSVDIA